MAKRTSIILTKKKPEKRLLIRLPKRAGRSRSGKITVRHKGGGVKKLYRMIDFDQRHLGVAAKVAALEYDPYRTGHIMLLEYADGAKSYQIAPQGIAVGDEILASENAPIKNGNRTKMKNMPLGTKIYNVEIVAGKGGSMIRSAGSSAEVMANEGKYVQLKMPSGEIRKVLSENYASVGAVSNPEHRFVNIGKAGTNRLKGKRPSVRGSAMSAYAHPHGGGEGKAGIGMPYPKTPWGKIARGGKTRKRKHTDKYILKKKRPRKKK